MIPVVVFAFRRADLLERTLDALRRDGVPEIIAYSDGPRDDEDAADVARVRKLLRSVTWCGCQIRVRTANLGLGRSVRAGVGETLREHEAVIVFEDDLVCQPGTYRYLTAALTRYAGDRRVMSVTGWTHPRVTPAGLRDTPYFDGKAECWIWGTWRRAWPGMDRPAGRIMADCVTHGIDPARYGEDMPKMAAEAERKNLWAVGWWYHHMLSAGLCLRPPWSLGEHTGWDDRATTTTPAALRWRNPPLRPAPPVPVDWPEPAEHPDCVPLWRATARR